ncbi:diguanylate cyclase response regulator [Shewanella submarina]|uniref:diguanylate cyclase n=1 Tax=Shewanella submarina TaxID=2016376 RepID=A0ABV7GHL2_9GAMM|nr:diguanylate cyclase response regulator [Shewanella submarina]MCL1038115.1 diguanylate cyclase response regulator [Shewanella submarina]
MSYPKQNVLLIEDQDLDAKVVIRSLKQVTGIRFDVRVVKRVSDVESTISDFVPNVVLADLSLPDSQCDETVRRIMNMQIDAPVVVLTGIDDELIDMTSMEMGVQDYMLKEDINPRSIKKTILHAMERYKLHNMLEDLANKDSLTRAFNRRYFFNQAQIEFERAKRYQTSLSIALFDIDNFKMINDEYGHLAGDDVLKSIVADMLSIVRTVDIVARFGGEEFVILLPHTELEGALVLANRILTEIAGKKVLAAGQAINVTLSCGVTKFSNEMNEFKDVLNLADQALYDAKSNGKNCVMSK